MEKYPKRIKIELCSVTEGLWQNSLYIDGG